MGSFKKIEGKGAGGKGRAVSTSFIHVVCSSTYGTDRRYDTLYSDIFDAVIYSRWHSYLWHTIKKYTPEYIFF